MFTLNCKGRLIVIDEPIVMGIINTTPDSFYTGSRISEKDAVLQKVEQMINDGAAIIDIGGQSTRPGSERISAEEERDRVIPLIEAVYQRFPEVIISIDSFYSSVVGLIQLELPEDAPEELSTEEVNHLYDNKVKIARSLMQKKNHDYGEAWRNMSQESFVDLILMKLQRMRQIISNEGKTMVSEGLDANYTDIINYAVFALILANEK